MTVSPTHNDLVFKYIIKLKNSVKISIKDINFQLSEIDTYLQKSIKDNCIQISITDIYLQISKTDTYSNYQ